MNRGERSRQRRDRIIGAALSCFTELGYERTTMADIRHRSQASTGSIYHHFKSKEQLAAVVYLEGIRDYQAGLLRVLERQDEASEGVRAVVRYHLTWVVEHTDWARFLLQMRHAEFMAGTEEAFRDLNSRFARGMADWVVGQVRKGRIRGYARDVFIAILLGPCQEYARQWIGGQAVTEPQAAAEEIADAVWAALGGC